MCISHAHVVFFAPWCLPRPHLLAKTDATAAELDHLSILSSYCDGGFSIILETNDITLANVKNHPPGIPNLVRMFRRRLGLTQQELAYLVGYDSDSQVSRIENGSRIPHLAEVLMIELIFGVPGVAMFPRVRDVVGRKVRSRLRKLTFQLRNSGSPRQRVSYKTAQLECVLASLRTRDASDWSGRSVWHAKT